MRAAFVPVVDAARARITETFDGTRLHSAYPYGSIPRGTATPGVSDLDLQLALYGEPTEGDRADAKAIEVVLDRAFPQIDGVGILLTSTRVQLSDAEPHDGGFFIACLCTPVLGPDLAEQLPRYRPTALLARETNGDLARMLPRWRAKQLKPRRPVPGIRGDGVVIGAAPFTGAGASTRAPRGPPRTESAPDPHHHLAPLTGASGPAPIFPTPDTAGTSPSAAPAVSGPVAGSAPRTGAGDHLPHGGPASHRDVRPACRPPTQAAADGGRGRRREELHPRAGVPSRAAAPPRAGRPAAVRRSPPQSALVRAASLSRCLRMSCHFVSCRSVPAMPQCRVARTRPDCSSRLPTEP